jgi:hypothetical protein
MAVSSGRALSPRADGDDSANEVVAAVRSILSRGSSKAWSRKLASLPACRLEEGAQYVLGRTTVFIKDPTTVHMLEERRSKLLPAIVTKASPTTGATGP